MFDGETLVFVEVKTRRARVGGAPGPRRARWRPAHASAGGCAGWPRRGWRGDAAGLAARELRFDAVGVVLDERDRPLRLEHVEGAL